jgi:hypothetical protein
MKFFYSASVMGYGNGRYWHRFYDFPNLPRVTKTLTLDPKRGFPFAILKWGNTVWNAISLHNKGFWHFWLQYNQIYNNNYDITVSLAGTDIQIEYMIRAIEYFAQNVKAIELNFSCPNVKPFNNKKIINSKLPIYLKLNHLQDPFDYDLDKIKGIRLNSVPYKFGALSGQYAKKYNWPFIETFNKKGLNVAGCSVTKHEDVKRLEDIGCKEIGIGSLALTNPKMIDMLI